MPDLYAQIKELNKQLEKLARERKKIRDNVGALDQAEEFEISKIDKKFDKLRRIEGAKEDRFEREMNEINWQIRQLRERTWESR
jgi:predicted RNase H-like nuclease (RuvC/YqgF family)